LLQGTYNLLRDMAKVTFDGIYWLWHKLWLANRGLSRTFLPGQSKGVRSVVTTVAVILEIVGIWILLVHWARTRPLG
jgi:hypothetical protein